MQLTRMARTRLKVSEHMDAIANLVIDTRLDSYASFFDHEWAQSFGALSDRTRLRMPGFDLTRDWKGIAVASRMPWLMIESLKGFHVGFSKTNPPFYARLTEKLGEYVLKESQLSNMRKQELLATLNHLRTQVERDIEQAGPALDREEIWQEYLQVREFGLALWNAQRISYGAIYYAFDSFVQRAVAAGKRDDAYKAWRFADLVRDARSVFDDATVRECLEHPDVDVARLVRNCLTHDGGRISAQLRAKEHGLRVAGDEIHIMPHDVRRLFDLLKVRACRIADVATRLPAFAPE